MAKPVPSNDSYTGAFQTPLLVGIEADFNQQGSAAAVDAVGFAPDVPGVPFIERGTRASVGVSGLASALQIGQVFFGGRAEVAPQGNAGSVVTDPSTAEADWQLRISGPGVVWYHDFRSDAEVDAFRWGSDPDDPGNSGNNPNDVVKPNTIYRQTADGITGGGCLEAFRPAGGSDGSSWWRPLSPMASPGNGKATDDPGANGTISVQTWAPTQGGDQTANWNIGYYMNPDYQGGFAGQFDGSEFYFQARVKIDPQRIEGTNGNGGKLFYITRTDQSLTSQEIVTESAQQAGSLNYFSMYRSLAVCRP